MVKKLFTIKSVADLQTVKKANGEGGFTLIELMIVIAIIGILSAIAIPQYASYVRTSEATTAAQDVHEAITTATTAEAQAQAGIPVTISSFAGTTTAVAQHNAMGYVSGWNDVTSPSTLSGTDGAKLDIAPGSVPAEGTPLTITLVAPTSSSVATQLGAMLDQQLGTSSLSSGAGTILVSPNGAITFG